MSDLTVLSGDQEMIWKAGVCKLPGNKLKKQSKNTVSLTPIIVQERGEAKHQNKSAG